MLIVLGLVALVLLLSLRVVRHMASDLNEATRAVERFNDTWTLRDAERRMEELLQSGFQAMLDATRPHRNPSD